jgi:hypothetical protein
MAMTSKLSPRRLALAKAFVLQIYTTLLLFKRFAEMHPDFAQPANEIVQTVEAKIPGLKAIRDSLAHFDERAYMMADMHKKKPIAITPQPSSPGSPGGLGMAILGGLYDNAFVCIDRDGNHPSVPISADTLAILKAAEARLKGVVDERWAALVDAQVAERAAEGALATLNVPLHREGT